ncbi:MAG TPA: transglycosylase SLT domain-containing protein [Nevskiaceae bacterium]
MKRRLAVLLLLLASGTAFGQLPAVNSPHWPHTYDRYFRKYSKYYFGPFRDWRWFKAQAIAESLLNPHAHNPSGSAGLMQLEPSTFAKARRKAHLPGNIYQPRWNIAAGIYHDRQLYEQPVWNALSAHLRLLVSFAAYNAGLGGAKKGYREAPKPVTSWLQIAPHLPEQTQHYVSRIVEVKTGHPPRATPAQPPRAPASPTKPMAEQAPHRGFFRRLFGLP